MVAEPQQNKKSIPDFRPGDTVRVYIKVVEGESERIQMFEGTVISKRGAGDAINFTVRKISFGVGVERTFPLFSPHIDKVEVTKSGRVRRSRLYYLRNLTGKAARLDEKDQPGPDQGQTPPAAAAEKPHTEAKPKDAKAAKPAAGADSKKAGGTQARALGAA